MTLLSSPQQPTAVPSFKSLFQSSEHVLLLLPVALLAGLLTLLLWRKTALWKVGVALFAASVAWTWVRLYKVALSRKQATLERLGDVPKRCSVERRGWWEAVKGATYGVFGNANSGMYSAFDAL